MVPQSLAAVESQHPQAQYSSQTLIMKLFCVLVLLLAHSRAVTAQFSCITFYRDLIAAVDDYLMADTFATATYGPIKDWCLEPIDGECGAAFSVIHRPALSPERAAVETFNEDISGWNTTSCTSLTFMFYLSRDFNQDISGWVRL